MSKTVVRAWIHWSVWVTVGNVANGIQGGVVKDCFVEEEDDQEIITFDTNKGTIRCLNNDGKSIKFFALDGSTIQLLPPSSV